MTRLVEKAHESAAAQREQKRRSPVVWLSIALIALVAAFTALAPTAFPTAFNIRSVLIDASVLLVLSVGQTFVIATAGIDLSVGAVLVFSGVLSDAAMIALGGGAGAILVGLIVSLGSGLAWGLANGLLITKARIPPLIATLGTYGIAFGVAQIITNGNDMAGVPPALVETVGLGRLFGFVPWLVAIAAAVTLIGGVALDATRFGRHTLGVGANPDASRRIGINVDRRLTQVYALAGFLSGLAGYLSLAQYATTTIQGHTTDNLQSITAVVLGGTSLFGGVASIAGTTIGVFIPAVLQSGLVIVGVQPFWQEAAIGVVLLLAVYFDQRHRGARSTR
jgi:ribose transport system permease protein